MGRRALDPDASRCGSWWDMRDPEGVPVDGCGRSGSCASASPRCGREKASLSLSRVVTAATSSPSPGWSRRPTGARSGRFRGTSRTMRPPCPNDPDGQVTQVRRTAVPPDHRAVPEDAVRHRLRGQGHRASADRAEPPSTDVRVGRMNRAIRDARVKRVHRDSRGRIPAERGSSSPPTGSRDRSAGPDARTGAKAAEPDQGEPCDLEPSRRCRIGFPNVTVPVYRREVSSRGGSSRLGFTRDCKAVG